MKGIIILVLCALIIDQCNTREGGHGHEHGHHHGHHGHEHGHHHGHHGHEHGHQHGHHGHDHGHHDDVDEHGHYHDEHQAAKFRYSKQANKVVEPVKQKEPEHHEDVQTPPHKEEHTHEEHTHEKKEHAEEEHSHSHGGDHGHSHGHGGHGHSHGGDDHAHAHKKEFRKKEPVYWMEPLLATAAISAAPFLILFLVPLSNNSPESKPFLKVLLSFASGGLLGDAFLHLIPHAISPHSHTEDGGHSHGASSHGHSHGEGGEAAHDHTGDMIVGLWVLGGIIAFLVVEKFVRFLRGGHGHSHGEHSHEEVIESEVKEAAHEEESEKPNGHVKKCEESNGDVKKSEKMNGEVKGDGEEEANGVVKKDHDESDAVVPEEVKTVIPSSGEDIKIAAYLNLVADCTHNFTDGLAIGASFLVSRNVGLITTLTIFLHEIPHEIGDFAILVQSGCTKRKAMLLQLVTAVGAFAGCVCGLLAEGLGTAASAWILPFTAGGFIYIATVSVIPELLVEANVWQSIKEILGLLVGVLLMVIIALTE